MKKPSWFHVNEVGYYLRRFNPDITFAFGSKGFPVVNKLRLKSLVVTRCGASKIEKIKRLKNANAILVTSNTIKDIAIAGGMDEKKLHVIPNFTIPNKINVSPRSIRSNLTLGAMGRFVSVKGFDILISAIAHLQSEGIYLDLLIAGSGPEEENLRRISNEIGVRTKFVGWLKDHEKSDFLKSLDIFVCPSREEPFGFVFLEAMEFSLPIVTTNTIGAHEIFKNHAGALISEIDNPISMAKSIQILLSNKSLMKEMGKANRQAYLENLSIESGTERLAEVMEALKKNAV